MSDEITVSEPRVTKKKRSGSRMLNALLIVAIVALGVLFFRAEKAYRESENNLQQKSQELEEIKRSTQKNSQEVVKTVLEDVRMLINIPADLAPTVATITDVDALRKTNDFYKKAENGDYLIVTADRAILYSALKNIIIDVVPVQIDPQSSVSPIPKATSTPTPNPIPTPTPTLP